MTRQVWGGTSGWWCRCGVELVDDGTGVGVEPADDGACVGWVLRSGMGVVWN